MDLPKKDNLDIEGFKERWALSPEQLSTTRRTEEELEIMQDFLLSIEEAFRKDITDWDLEDAFFLYQDENSEFEEDYILRMYSFSKGLTKCWLVIGCQPQIEIASENIDATLLANISNILLAHLYDVFVSD